GERSEAGFGRATLQIPILALRAGSPPAGEGEQEYRMPRYLKRGMDASALKAADAKVRETVESNLADIDARKDVAVRELSQKFDNWAPASFKLAPAEIERAIGQVR